MAPALALAGCGSKTSDELEARLARAEAAAQRAEKAQHAAEAAAARAKSDRIATDEVSPDAGEDAQSSEPEADPNQSSSDNQADDAG
jgi:hypothetical protein